MFDYFKSNKRLQQRARNLEAQLDDLRNERDDLKEQASEARAELVAFQKQRESEEREMRHLLKMDKERAEIENERFRMNCERDKEQEIATVKDNYRTAMEEVLVAEKANLKSMYSEVLERLPNISARLQIKEHSGG